jgi:hypothetical protein
VNVLSLISFSGVDSSNLPSKECKPSEEHFDSVYRLSFNSPFLWGVGGIGVRTQSFALLPHLQSILLWLFLEMVVS